MTHGQALVSAALVALIIGWNVDARFQPEALIVGILGVAVYSYLVRPRP